MNSKGHEMKQRMCVFSASGFFIQELNPSGKMKAIIQAAVIFIILLMITPFFVIFNEPFWIWVPINIWILHLVFSPVLVCPATVWENRLRRRLGMGEIKTFFLHYFIKPLKKLLGK